MVVYPRRNVPVSQYPVPLHCSFPSTQDVQTRFPYAPGAAAAANKVCEGEQQQQRQADGQADVEAAEVVPGRR